MAMKEINKTRRGGVENVILTQYLHIGDRVVMNMDAESRGRGRKGPDNDTKGVVVGFYRYNQDVTITDTYTALNPGIYEGNGAAIISWEDGTSTNEGSGDIYWEDQSLDDLRRKDKAYIRAYETMVKVADLPYVPYEAGDHILVYCESEGVNFACTISRINYLDIDKKRDDGSPYPYIQYRHDKEGWSNSCTEDEVVELIERGNYWKWVHARDTIAFKDLKEEAAFYNSLGFSEQVRNPKSGNYGWELDDILTAITEGTVDAVIMSGSFFGWGSTPLAFRYPSMPELGKRLREETLTGFADRLKAS